MAGASFNLSNSLPNMDVVAAPYGGNTAIPLNELLWLDSGVAKPVTSATNQGSESANQLYVASRFLGVSGEKKLSTDDITKAGASKHVVVKTQFVGEFDCAASTFTFGDMVGVADVSGGDTPATRTVKKVTNSLAAIGYVLKTYSENTTRVLVALFSRSLPIGGLPNTNEETGVNMALSGTLAVTGASNLVGDTTVGNMALSGTLAVTGASNLVGDTTVGNVSSAGIISFLAGTLAATGTVQGNAAAIVKQVTAVSAADNAKGVKLPAPAGNLSKILILKNTVATSYLKVYPNDSETVDGASSVNIAANEAAVLFSDGTNWFTLIGSTS